MGQAHMWVLAMGLGQAQYGPGPWAGPMGLGPWGRPRVQPAHVWASVLFRNSSLKNTHIPYMIGGQLLIRKTQTYMGRKIIRLSGGFVPRSLI